MKYTNEQLKLAANTVRCLCADMVEKAKSGHPGAPMGLADLAVSLWLNYLDFDPKDTQWESATALCFPAVTVPRSHSRCSTLRVSRQSLAES